MSGNWHQNTELLCVIKIHIFLCCLIYSVDYHRAEMTASQDEEESNYSSIFMSTPVNLIKLIGGQ